MGAPPEVAVPPTFVWTRDVESAWARAGIRVVVTPGRQSEGRDAEGRLTFADRLFFNGARGPDGLQYVVRDCYFEPSLGHTHEQALLAVADKSDRGRPALVEMHRMNFIGPEARAQDALRELRRFIESVSSRFKTVRFMSTAELAAHYRGPSDLLETRYASRVHFLLRRLSDVSRLRKLALVTGAILPAWLVYATTRPRAS
jgi:hypothetical protein